MALRMATPYRHPKTGIYWFRKAVPHALRGVVGKSLVQCTLDTRDPDEACRRFIKVAAEVQEEWAALSVVPDRLSHRARLALAGEFYRWTVERHTEEPGVPAFWKKCVQADTRALRPPGRMGAPWMVIKDELVVFLTERKLTVAEADMWDLTREAANALLLARSTILQQAKGDYRPNPEAERFPPYVAPTPPAPAEVMVPGAKHLTLDEHWDAFVGERKLALGTQKRWKPLIKAFETYIGRRNLATATPEEVGDWKLALVATGKLSNKTIQEGYLSALRTFYGWAVSCKKIKLNPVDGIKVAREKVIEDVPAKSRDFEPHHCALILSESLREPDQRMSHWTAAARRWIPWLCAYTGARVNEMTQLRKQDLLKDEVLGNTVWQIRITPSAGTVKGNKARDVPLHPHLVEQGFIDFVHNSEEGPLFYDPERSRGASKFNPTYRKVGDRLARWVREIGIDDPDIDPNHGWRHTFKSIARESGMGDLVIDGIAGHSPRTVGDKYGEVRLQLKWQQIALMPRYVVDKPSGRSPMTETRRRRNEQRVATAARAKRVA